MVLLQGVGLCKGACMEMTHHPRLGDKVWDESRHTKEGKQPNGAITRIDWDAKIVYVTWVDGELWTAYDLDHILEEYVSEGMGYMLRDYG